MLRKAVEKYDMKLPLALKSEHEYSCKHSMEHIYRSLQKYSEQLPQDLHLFQNPHIL